VVAEKFEAMVKLGKFNSRLKDFFDLWLLSRQFEFDGRLLSEAIARTFEDRKTVMSAVPIAADCRRRERSDQTNTVEGICAKVAIGDRARWERRLRRPHFHRFCGRHPAGMEQPSIWGGCQRTLVTAIFRGEARQRPQAASGLRSGPKGKQVFGRDVRRRF
jgi:hypothetical protein